jgi:NIPSNAP
MSQLTSIELRRYVTVPGRRDELIELFEREFIDSQAEHGMTLIGHYRDLDRPDTFVWLRGFARVEDRGEALEAFYRRDPRWLDNKAAANATLVDNDNVLLLKPARKGSGFDLATSSGDPSVVGIMVRMLDGPLDDAIRAGLEPGCVYLETDPTPNAFPALPVRDEWALVAVKSFASTDDLDRWAQGFPGAEVLRLEPAPRSRFR